MVTIEQHVWGMTPEGEAIILYTMRNDKGAEVKLSNFGAAIVSVTMPDREGRMADVVLGYKHPEGYFFDGAASGKSVGRCANRIAFGRMTVEGKEYALEVNNGPNHLHGCFSRKLYRVKAFGDTLLMEAESPDGEDGFPGNLKLAVRYTLTEDNTFRMDYRVSSDADTIVNLTNHSYFNLNGEGDILGQKLRIYASNYLEGNNQTCPTGAILPVANTPMDFTEGKLIGRDIDTGFAQTTMVGGGYDHCFVIDRARGSSQSICAWVTSEKTGISMKLYTTQPGIQLYTGNFLQDCPTPGKGGVPMQKYGGFALETQHYPCSPSHPEFPTTVLRAGKVFRATTTLRFFTGKQCGKL